MAVLNPEGTIRAQCKGCRGALSNFEWRAGDAPLGAVHRPYRDYSMGDGIMQFRLYRCMGCSMGALAAIATGNSNFPSGVRELVWFHPEAKDRLELPKGVPDGIKKEFLEGETCLEAGAFRAAAAMFRSVLDKTLRENGYKAKKGTTLEQQIDLAAGDGVITQARKRRAHDEVRVLGNDVLHDEWQPVREEDVNAARHYSQRVLEDFYDDRDSVLKQLYEAKRLEPPAEA
jgi:Domain of unknown function (DUF4145)